MGDSPMKKLNFEGVGKENIPFDAGASLDGDIEIKKPVVEQVNVEPVKVEKAVVVAPTIKAEEADEPLLQENPHRFVLFPIKYHEVSLTRRRV